jgi:3-oxoacid CoA-transferase subunit A
MDNPFQKIFTDANAALFDVFDEARIMSGGFGLSGIAENCITALANSGKKRFTIISNNCGNQRQGLAVLLQNRQIQKVICSYVGGNPDLEEQMLAGEIDVELNPQGTFAERIRAGGAGIGGFYTPTGVGTVVAEGKDERVIDGKRMVLDIRQLALLPNVSQFLSRHGHGWQNHHRRGRRDCAAGQARSRRHSFAWHFCATHFCRHPTQKHH